MVCDFLSLEIILLFFALHSKAKRCKFAIAIIAQCCCCCCWLSFSALSPFYLHKIFFCNGRDSFLIFYRPQLYNLEALPFTYCQYVVTELALRHSLSPELRSNRLAIWTKAFYDFHPNKQLFQIAGAGDWTTDPWITRPLHLRDSLENMLQ